MTEPAAHEARQPCTLIQLLAFETLVPSFTMLLEDTPHSLCLHCMLVQDAEVQEQIDRDVTRTHPDMHFFSSNTAVAARHREVRGGHLR